MALRFRRSIKLAPGIRWNISGSSSSWTLGTRGASVSFGKRGTHLNTGIPGTGISSRQQLSGPKRRPKAEPSTTMVSLSCTIDDDGNLGFTDGSGNPASEYLINAAKKQSKDALLGLITRKCDEINVNVEALGRLHLDTPNAREKPKHMPAAFDHPQPQRPSPARVGLLEKLFASRRRRIEAQNTQAAEHYSQEVASWKRDQAAHEQSERQRRDLVERLIYTEPSVMEQFLEQRLLEIVWPRETLVALDVVDQGQKILLDVDLPEIEDMPTKLAAVPARGLKLSVKELSATKVQRLYMEHVHAVVFRLVGESFTALPLATTVVASGYSQRRDPATGTLRDDYLLSVRVTRSAWLGMDFKALSSVDVVEALAQFDLLRLMSKTGVFKPVVPHSS